MARKSRSEGPTPVGAFQHDAKRVNIPTADAEDFVGPEHLDVPKAVYTRDPSLDPQLVWTGKYDRDVHELAADAPPIYIQEKIDARVLVENLRRTAAEGDLEPELTLFEDFDGLDPLAAVEFYQHDANWSNRMILGDSLQVMASLSEREALRGKVQMIYIDPPYGIKFGSNWQVSARKRDVKDGKLEDAAREAEQIKAFRDTWELGIHSYLSYLRDRLTVARDLLTESGSVFVQIGVENVHLVRGLLDETFGSENLVSQIAVRKTATPSRVIDDAYFYVIWYAKDVDRVKYRQLWSPRSMADWILNVPKNSWGIIESDGTKRSLTAHERANPRLIPSGVRLYALSKLTSAGAASVPQGFEWDGRVVFPPGNTHWKTTADGMRKLVLAERVESRGGPPWFRRFHDDFPAIPVTNNFDDTAGKSVDPIYVVQTQPDVIQRCLLMTTDPGDLILDPTCGSGTAAYVAEQWGRRWITIDTSRVALALARQRLMGSRYPYYLLADSADGRAKEAELTVAPPATTPITDDLRHGFVYERVQHITLKSIANNPDIREGMTREEIDRAIKRHADFELLYDRPYEDKKKVRVSGPFTVESLSPHRSLAFAQPAETRESGAEEKAALDSDSTTFEASILANLGKAGIQNGRRAERIEFSAVSAYAGNYLQAIGERADLDGESQTRVGIAIGPQYGTVSPSFIKNAAREAIRAGDIGLVCVLGFAFDPQATGVTQEDGVTVDTSDDGFDVAGERSLGAVQVLLVRMNADLLMGEDLKKTGAGNLFTVFGEPEIDLTRTPSGEVVVELLGVDVYDPTTGEVRSNSTDRIALWMIDTDYDEESFFVRHCYFTGGNDPLKRLKTALKADIDADAWATLYGTTSRPFDPPSSGKIAVKVINDYGDEVMKIFDVP